MKNWRVQTLKTTRYIILFIVAVTGFVMAGCDKKDCNGDLDGMWQMTLWTRTVGVNVDTLATKDSMIFYCFQLQMMNFKRYNGPHAIDILSMFKKSNDSIIIYDVQNYNSRSGNDTIFALDTLQYVGVPADSTLKIESLSSDYMSLSTKYGDRLTFRKY